VRANGGIISELKRNSVLYVMVVPVILYFLVFCYLPMAGIVMAFKNFNYVQKIFRSPWNGFNNFRYFFVSGKAWLVTRNTFMYNLIFIAAYNFFSLVIAIFVAEMSGKLYKKSAQSFMFLPYFISWVVTAALMYNLFNYEFGIVNNILKSLGKKSIDIYSNPKYWYFILPAIYVWKWAGFGSVLYLAAIMGIDQECYEAAKIDGATVYQKIFFITLPNLKPTLAIMILLGLGRIARGEFDMFYQLIGNNGLLMNSTDIIDTLVFRSLMGTLDFGMASAAGAYQSVLCFVILMLANYTIKKMHRDYALF